MTIELVFSIIANLTLAVLYLAKRNPAMPAAFPAQEAPPGQPCSLHSGLVLWLKEIRDTGKETARELAAVRVDIARLEERIEKSAP